MVRLEESLHTRISYSKVKVGLFRPVYFENFLIRDQQGDTLIFVKKVSTIPVLNISTLKNKKLILSRAVAEGAFVRLISPPGKENNYDFLFNPPKKDSTVSSFYFSLRHAILKDSRFQLKVLPPDKEYGIRFTDLKLYNINGTVNDLSIYNKILRLSAVNVSFTDSSGWQVNDFSSDLESAPRHLWFDHIKIITPWSRIFADYYHMDFRHRSDMKDFINKVELSAVFRPSVFGYRDMNMLAQDSLFIHNDFRFSMEGRGTLANLTAKKLHLWINDKTQLTGTLNLIGLPDIKNTYIYFNIQDLVTGMDDIRNIYIPKTKRKINVPENFNNLGQVRYKGNFTGFFTDFVSYGRLETDIGSFNDDISFSTDSGKVVHFNGFLAAEKFDLGKFSGNEKLMGRITMHSSMNGKIFSGKRFRSKLTGTIDSIEFNHYLYHSVMLDGTFTEKAYDGSIRIDDPNLKLDFLGMFDFTNRLPEFDFSLNIPKAALFPLHLTYTDTNLLFSGLVLANFKGNNLQDFNGQVKLLDAQLRRGKKSLKIYNIKLLAYNTPDTGSLKITSGYFEASLNGKYNFSSLSASVKSLLSRFIPAAIPDNIPGQTGSNNFIFSVNIHNIDPFTDFFAPGFSIAHRSTFEGRFSPDIHLLSLQASSDRFITPGIMADSLKINLMTNDVMTLEISGNALNIKKKIHLSNFSADFTATKDSVQSYLSWFNRNDTTNTENNLHLLAGLYKDHKMSRPGVNLFIDSTDLLLNDRVWAIEKEHINIDSSFLQVHHFKISSGDRSLLVSGKLSANPADTLQILFHRMDLSYLNQKNEKTLQLEGYMNGRISLSNVYKTPLFLSEIEINGLKVNHEPLGNASGTSSWDTLKKQIVFAFRTDFGTIHPIIAEGTYSPSQKNLAGDIYLDKLKLSSFSSFVSAVFSKVQGNVSGKAHIEGPARKPEVNGLLTLQKTSLAVDYLKTQYTFTSKVPIEHNRFLFNNIKVYDEKGNIATAHGYFSIEDFKNPAINLTLETGKFQFINTTQKDNDYFYGTAYGSGVVSIKGPLSNIRMNISSKTGPNTRITLPLYQGKTISAYNYIHFVSGKNIPQKKATGSIKKIETRGINLNLDLEVTPDAEVTILFDPNTGGNLYARGHGNLRMEIKKTGDFSLLGEYTVEKGSYLFSLENVIQKKFRLESGGKITWNGNPMDANLNILATYPIKTSLYPLFFDENYKKRVPVECQIILKGKLNKPNIGFNIDLPTVDEETRTKVENAISSEEELSKQFLSLLILNSFYPNPAYGQPGENIASANALGVTTTEVLSNQLSSWLSQISNDVDVGFSYHPGDQVTSDQVEVALSTQLLNDRVSIYSNIDFSGQSNTNTQSGSNVVGDFQVEVKITKNGKLRVKAFTRANDKYLYETAPYTNGVGIFYREEFSSWGSLFRKYLDSLFGKKEKEIKVPAPK